MTIRAGVVRDSYELEQPIVMGAKEREDSQRRPQMACQRGIKVKEGKSGGKVIKCMTKWFLGDLWENTLGEGRGITHQQGA